MEIIALDSIGLELKDKLEILKVEAPSVREGGMILESVDDLIDKLKNEAKIL